METSGALRFLENPDGHCPCSATTVGPDAPCGTKCDTPDAAPACVQDEGSPRLVISGLNHTTFDLATLRRVGRPSATQDLLLAAGPALPGGICTGRASVKGFKVRVSSSSPRPFLTKGHRTQLKGRNYLWCPRNHPKWPSLSLAGVWLRVTRPHRMGFPCCVRSPFTDMPSSIPRWLAGL
jgi:hypothetical protein